MVIIVIKEVRVSRGLGPGLSGGRRSNSELLGHYISWHFEGGAIRIFIVAASKSAIQIMIPVIVFGFLLPSLVSVAALFVLFGASKRLEHPILIIFASILLITGQPWLHRPLKLDLLDFSLAWDPFLSHPRRGHLVLVIVGAGRRIALPGAHQPLVDLLIPLKDALVFGAPVVRTEGPLLGDHEVNLGDYWTIPARVLPGGGGRLSLQLRILGVWSAWRFGSNPWHRGPCGTWLL